MTIIVPNNGKNLVEIMSCLDWIEVRPKDGYEVDLSLPKFSFVSRIDLRETFSTLGLGEVFDTDSSLPKITDTPVRIGQIFQQCAISVSEQGTEYSTTTIAKANEGCIKPEETPKYHSMTVDRPFGFAITDYHGNILFIGMVNHLDNA